jgi:hypothetical protein
VAIVSAPSIFEWLTTSSWANAMNGPEWAFPLVQSLHFIGFACGSAQGGSKAGADHFRAVDCI